MRNELRAVLLGAMLCTAACAGSAETPAYASAAGTRPHLSSCTIPAVDGDSGCEVTCSNRQAICRPASSCRPTPAPPENDEAAERAAAASDMFVCMAEASRCACE